jgi:hypothetical protein
MLYVSASIEASSISGTKLQVLLERTVPFYSSFINAELLWYGLKVYYKEHCHLFE